MPSLRELLFGPPEFSALSSRNYRTYLYGNIFSVLGVWIQRLALGWQAWELSQSAFAVGVVAAAQFLPLLVLTPFFGVMADRIRPRAGAIWMHVVMASISATLALLTLAGRMNIEWLFVLALLHGVANSAYSPIRLSLVPDLVSPVRFPSAVAISSVVFNLSRFVGPGIGGVIVAAWGLGYAYLINACTYLPVVLALTLIRIDRHQEHGHASGGYLAQLGEGLRYARNHASIRQVILLVGVSSFFGRSVLELLPAYAALVFRGGSGVLAALLSASGVGAVVAGLLFSTGILRLRLRASVVVGSFGVCAAMFLFGLSDRLAVGIVTVALLGFFTTFVAVGSQSEVQIHVDNRLRGRVLSLWTILAVGGPALGSVAAGALAVELGAKPTSLLFSALCLAFVLALGIRRRDADSGAG
ncbi:MAG: MFS transporter [Gammaproteobacteria bacterium]|nr:MFS transporter [Gammaproteobacteria bacterium]MDH4253603.1 MFS transporter [Gammaproteobacteria bacterium]MDH5310366.1 MFS transporter [Gammaproteobacteria bacterium]